jgi:hypothetical protein
MTDLLDTILTNVRETDQVIQELRDICEQGIKELRGVMETILICDRCGEEAYRKFIGDEVYDWCDGCGCVEECTHEEPVDE